jgi:1-pyrroline-5-carboxylate dehydrogenase
VVGPNRPVMEKITYASLGTLGEEFHRSFETALSHERKKLGHTHPLLIQGHAVKSSAGTFDDLSPTDTHLLLGKFQRGTREHMRKAIAAAKTAFPVWRELGWQQRVAFMRKAAELMTRHQFDLAALLCLEVGKNRFEAIAEVAEAVDLILYYCRQIETHQGYELGLGGSNGEYTRSLLQPYGVWAVISPFNFPLALATGMTVGALLAGNTVVFKPASDAPFAGLRLYELLHHAGLPVGVFNFVTGSGEDVGAELMSNPDLDGLIFTGSRAVGMQLLHQFTRERPRPCVTEMGGKNPALIMPTANLDDAAEGVLRAAFGLGGQKCSACSRVYVHKQVYKPFLDVLAERIAARKVGDPAERDTFLGPLINGPAVAKFKRAVELGKKQGRMVRGGNILKSGVLAHGHFVEPTLIDQLPKDSALFQEEFFVPVLAVAEMKSLDEGITLANDSAYGLTAGIFTQIEDEQREFFDRIEAGVAYCNRRGGATTGAWPGVQSFGGWKSSGSSGKNALGPYYVAQFMREQSRTLMRK